MKTTAAANLTEYSAKPTKGGNEIGTISESAAKKSVMALALVKIRLVISFVKFGKRIAISAFAIVPDLTRPAGSRTP